MQARKSLALVGLFVVAACGGETVSGEPVAEQGRMQAEPTEKQEQTPESAGSHAGGSKANEAPGETANGGRSAGGETAEGSSQGGMAGTAGAVDVEAQQGGAPSPEMNPVESGGTAGTTVSPEPTGQAGAGQTGGAGAAVPRAPAPTGAWGSLPERGQGTDYDDPEAVAALNAAAPLLEGDCGTVCPAGTACFDTSSGTSRTGFTNLYRCAPLVPDCLSRNCTCLVVDPCPFPDTCGGVSWDADGVGLIECGTGLAFPIPPVHPPLPPPPPPPPAP